MHPFLQDSLKELLCDSKEEFDKPTRRPPGLLNALLWPFIRHHYLIGRIYGRCKMVCGVIDALLATNQLVLSDRQMAAYRNKPGGFRYNCWEILWRHGALNPRQCCHQLMAQIKHFCAQFPPSG